MSTRILLIDEDPQTLKSYREALAPKAPLWILNCTSSADEGLESAREHRPDIVIAALSTNDGHGAQILSEIEKIAPSAQRFITATEADKPKLKATFGSTFQFLPNPCPANRLVTEIQRCVAIETWLADDRIKRLVAKIGEFPSLPPVYLKVVNALNSRDASAGSIAQAISGDLAISAKVLQTVNSSYYGFDQKISNITQAVGVLGVDCVKNLVLAIQVFSKLGSTEDHRALIDELWHHSMSVAITARRIALHETEDEKIAEEAYTAGLLHDIGKLVLLNAEPDLYDAARQHAREESIPLWSAEDQLVGSNHAEIGAYLLARWGMPTNLTEAVALHHQPTISSSKTFSPLAAVHVANALIHYRLSEDHPGAFPSQEFLTEIGKHRPMETWADIASGKAQPASAPAKLSLKKEPAQEPSPSPKPVATPVAETTSSTPAATATKAAAAAEEESEPTKSKTPLYAFAACLSLAAIGIFALNHFGNDTPASETAQAKSEAQLESTFAKNLEKARDIAGLTRTENSLQEIFDSQDTAEPIAQTAPAALPKPQISESVSTFPNIELTGIFFKSDNPVASVNGKIRRVGDTVDGAQIIRIEKHLIVVQFEKTIRSFKLN